MKLSAFLERRDVILLFTTSEAAIVEYVSYGPVLDLLNIVYMLFLPWVLYRGRIFK